MPPPPSPKFNTNSQTSFAGLIKPRVLNCFYNLFAALEVPKPSSSPQISPRTNKRSWFRSHKRQMSDSNLLVVNTSLLAERPTSAGGQHNRAGAKVRSNTLSPTSQLESPDSDPESTTTTAIGGFFVRNGGKRTLTRQYSANPRWSCSTTKFLSFINSSSTWKYIINKHSSHHTYLNIANVSIINNNTWLSNNWRFTYHCFFIHWIRKMTWMFKIAFCNFMNNVAMVRNTRNQSYIFSSLVIRSWSLLFALQINLYWYIRLLRHPI